MIYKESMTGLPSAIQFDAVSVGDSLVASHITVSSAILASLGTFTTGLTVTGTLGVAGVTQLSDASVARLVASSNIQGVVGSFNGIILASDITAIIVSVNRVIAASNIQGIIGSFNRLEVASNVQAVGGSFSGSVVIAGGLQASAASFAGALTVGAGACAITMATTGVLTVNASLVASAIQANLISVTNQLAVGGSFSVAGVSQFSAASFSGTITVENRLQFNPTIPAGVLTEVGGELLEFAINVPQIGTRDNARSGGIFRFDTRTAGDVFTIFTYATGQSAAFSAFSINLNTGSVTIGTNITFQYNATVGGALIVAGSHSVSGVSQFSAASFVGQTILGIGTTGIASTALASKQVAIAASAGSVIVFTWKNSAGNMYRATLSGASV